MQTPALSMLGVLLSLAHQVHISLSDLVYVCVGYLSSLPLTRFLFAFFTCTPGSKEVLGVPGFGLTWRAPSS